MTSTTSAVTITRRGRKRGRTPVAPAATITVTVTTSRSHRAGWMHALEARSAAELRQLVLRDLDDLAHQVWRAPSEGP